MNKAFPFLTLLFFCSCKQQNEQKTTAKDKVVHSIDSIPNVNSQKNNDGKQKTPDSDFIVWEKYEDSLRNEILNRKENNILKQSFLQEMYIRNVVTVLNGNLFFIIPFDLHSRDCIAPDCYRTDVSFGFKLGNTLRFPEKLQFKEHEHGCVDNETTISDFFQLKELSANYVIYHSAKYKRTLVLFRINNKSGAYAFYFTKVGPDKISGKNVYKIMENYNEEDENSIHPFTSWVLSTNEYENFAH